MVVYKALSKAGFQVQHTLVIRRESKVSLEESSQGQHVLEPDQWLYNLTLFESLTHWFWISGHLILTEWVYSPVYLVLMLYSVFFWNTSHFYVVHRLLHWPPLYRIAHELHHRNVNTGPWSGISMHPLEHLMYFSVFLLWWVVPVHPVIILLTGFFQGLSPAVSHSGFDQLTLPASKKVRVGDHFYHLHHKHFEVNYGNMPTPLDRVFGSWHEGTTATHALMKCRKRLVLNSG